MYQLQKEFFFPTQVAHLDFEETAEQFNPLFTAVAYHLKDSEPEGYESPDAKDYSHRLGWHSDKILHKAPELKPFWQTLQQAMVLLIEQMGISKDYQPVLTNAWANISGRYASNALHVHPNCHFSGVYYVQTPEGCGDIKFVDPRVQRQMVKIHYDKTGPLTWGAIRVKAEAGKALVFPAWLGHEVLPNLTELQGRAGDRISISFNYLLKKTARD
jgi:uncharacterized protein (TIGR02466 family)